MSTPRPRERTFSRVSELENRGAQAFLTPEPSTHCLDVLPFRDFKLLVQTKPRRRLARLAQLRGPTGQTPASLRMSEVYLQHKGRPSS